MGLCLDNHWQPTFVHEVGNPAAYAGPYYVMPNNGGFIRLRGSTGPEWVQHARELIQAHGVRDSRGYTNPEQYTNIQCGCQRGASEGNSTCALFLAGH